jgi:carboxypeptidase PM20D1
VLNLVALVGGFAGVLLATVLLRTLTAGPDQPEVRAVVASQDAEAVAAKLAELVRHPTVSHRSAAATDPAPFVALGRSIDTLWPSLRERSTLEHFGHSRLYTVAGTDPSLPPVLLLAHMDVVPVENAAGWQHPPFSGTVAQGFVHGRGTMDMKAAMVGILEALDQLLAAGWRPERTVYVALGEDEEVGGHRGARRIAAALQQRGVRLGWVLDEGLMITSGLVPGVERPAALVATAEKGYLTVELVARAEGGHSSRPPPHTAAGRVAAAVARVENAPFHAEISGPTAEMFQWLGPHAGMPERLAFANLDLLGGLVQPKLAAKPATAALLGTTIAVTQLSGSVQENVLPQEARAVVNLRLHPRDSIASALAHLRVAIDDPSIELNPLPATLHGEPSPVSPTEGPGWEAITRSIREVDPEIVVAPGLMIGGTDSRWFLPPADAVYRFQPARIGPGDTGRFHGTDERVSVENLGEFVVFYRQLLQRL